MLAHNQLSGSMHRNPRRIDAAVVMLILACLAMGPSVLAQDTPKELRQKAFVALEEGNYKEAIPALSTLIQMLGESKTVAVVAELEMVYFNLGMCNFLTGNFADAGTAFDAYMKKYRHGIHAKEVAVYRADALRFQSNNADALKAYAEALKQYGFELNLNWKTDVLCAMAKCNLFEEHWKEASQCLVQVVQNAPDFARRNWAASILVASYLKDSELDKAYKMMSYLLHPDSFASRSVYLNMTALEAGDLLFADEKCRDALWVYRMIYPKDVLQTNCENHRDYLMRRIELLRKSSNRMRDLLCAQESLGEVEQELKIIAEIKDYDSELIYRIGRSYQSISRHREACDIFYNMYEDQATTNRVEECLYLAFSSAAQVQPLDKALKIGNEYMIRYPGGEYYGDVSLNSGQISASMQDWLSAVNTLTNALVVMPKHPYVAECMFLIGYAYFMQEEFTNTVKWLTDLNTKHPGNDRLADATYWLGMANLFDKKYEAAGPYFDKIIAEYPDSQYVEDACFRSATCDFGLSLFVKAEPKFLMFVERYPASKLRGEAYLNLGDIAGALTKLPKAVERYQKAADYPDLNIELYNYAMFRCGEILMELKDYDRTIRHFDAYIQRNREGSNIPMAIYWVGNAYWQKNQQESALAYYRRAIEKFGKDRKELGIDLILEEWVGRSRTGHKDVAQSCWRDMHELHRKAVAEKEKTLALRIERILRFDPDADDAARAKLAQSIVQESNLEFASAGILDLIEEEALKAGNRELALKAANKLIADFTETDYAIAARMFVAKDAIQRGDNDEAIMQLSVVREVFAASLEAGEARLLLGDIYLKQKDYAEADLAYKELTASKEWKKLWPAALYGRAEILCAQKKIREASAFYERIYVLYSGHPDWAAKAYLKRAECLDLMFERQKAGEVLEEMLAQTELQTKPELETARQLLAKFKKQVSE